MRRLLAVLALVVLGSVAWLATRADTATSAVTPAPPAPLFDVPSERAPLVAPPPVVQASPVADVERARTPVRAEAAQGAHGRVVDGLTGAGVAGFRVRLLRVRDEVGAATSGADGGFRLPQTDGDAFIDVDPRRGWAVIDRLFHVTAEQARGDEPIVVRVRSLAQAPIRGTLVDTHTREPVPDMTLELLGHVEPTETVVTDAHGRFATRAIFDAGRVRVDLREGNEPFDRTWLDFSGSQAPVEVEIRMGPTYRFRVLGDAPAPEELGTLLVAEGRLEQIHAWRLVGLGSVRANGDAYVTRLGSDDARRAGDVPPWSLLVARRDGAAFGIAQVDAKRGRHERVLAVEMMPSGSVTGTVRRNGEPVVSQRVELRSTTEPGPRALFTTRQDGAFALRLVPAGAHVLSVRHDRSEPWSRELRIVGGAQERVDVDLVPEASAGSVAGVLLGTRPLRVSTTIQLWSTAPRRSMTAVARPVAGPEGTIGRFEISDVPPGEYRLRVDSDDDLEWAPNELVVRPPVTDLALRRLDAAPLVDFVVRAIDAETGAPLDGISFDVRRARGRAGTSASHGAVVFVAERPDDEEFEWRLSCAGYAAAFGDESAFVLRERGADRARLVAEVALERGWAQPFLVRASADGAPVAGAEIRLEGALAATTDEHGQAHVRAEREPEHVEVLHPAHAPYRAALRAIPVQDRWRRDVLLE